MERQVKKLLHDVFESIVSIEKYLGNQRVFKEYQNNKLVRRGVERELEIIGEAIKRLLDVQPGVEITDPRRIVNFRNRISHGYDNIDDSIVWGIIINHLPLLKEEVSKLLTED